MDFPVQRDSAMDHLQPNSHQSSCRLSLERVQKSKSSEFAKAASSSKGPEKSSVINSCNGSEGRQNLLISDGSNLVSDEQHRDQTSISVGLEAKRKTDTKYSDGASNNRNVCSRKHDDMEYSAHLSDVSGIVYLFSSS